MSEILLLITTESDNKKAKIIAKLLLKKKLAACVSIKEIYSIYEWGDDIEETKEVEITIKSKPELKDDLIVFLQKMISYDVPQILYKEFHSETKYGNWINKVLD